jgi:hypothetical protein
MICFCKAESTALEIARPAKREFCVKFGGVHIRFIGCLPLNRALHFSTKALRPSSASSLPTWTSI